jgi:hypothetical protein
MLTSAHHCNVSKSYTLLGSFQSKDFLAWEASILFFFSPSTHLKNMKYDSVMIQISENICDCQICPLVLVANQTYIFLIFFFFAVFNYLTLDIQSSKSSPFLSPTSFKESDQALGPVFNILLTCDLRSSGGEYEDYGHLQHDAMYFGRLVSRF